ncbi:MAG: hypothetical protein NTZ65_00825 [Candidatus Berkelbacteria bacterium]|nr:hypothetical protein [Candidatus Berkelbacteria bacterium]
MEILQGLLAFTDFAANPDENRLMIRHDNVLLPTNKEIARAIFRDMGIYAAIDAAKAKYGKDWRDHLVPEFIPLSVIEEATAISVELMAHAIAEIGNRMLGEQVFETQPIDSWVSPFLPYASSFQS